VNNLFDRVKEIPLSQVAREYFPSPDLKPVGQDLVGARCPLHDESTPSFRIYVKTNSWHCFGCGAGGSSIDLLIGAGLASKPLDAAQTLAEKFGINIDKSKRKALTVSQYADFCGLPDSFVRQVFDLRNSDAGVEILYKNEIGELVSIQRRHRLEKGAKNDGRFSWRKGDKAIPYGLWLLPETKTRLLVVEGASDVHVLAQIGITALGIPGASNFKPELVSSLLPFSELALIQEPGEPGAKFVSSIVTALKDAEYKGVVRAVSLPKKDPRALWLQSKDVAQFTTAMDQAIATAAPIELYPPIPLTKELITELSATIQRFVFFKNERVPLLIATWILATYICMRFGYFGILWINSPVLRCGKSRLIEIIDKLAWNSSGSTINASAASLFTMTDEGCTFLADEVENLRTADKEQFGATMAIINGGFSPGPTVSRKEKSGDGWIVRKYKIYGPKVIAGISTVTDTIRDRSFLIRMTRKSPQERTERLSMRRQGKLFSDLRASMALWAEENGEAIQDIYDNLPDEPALAGCDDRFLDIVEPLLSIVKFADAEFTNGGKRLIDELMPLFKELGGQRAEAQNDESIVALCGLLDVILGDRNELFVSSADLLEKIKGTPGLQWIGSTKSMATFMSKLDLVSRQKWVMVNEGRKQIRGYEITRDALEEIKLRYTPFEASQVSQTQTQSGVAGIF
jgi:hypothetical protein